MVELSVAMIVRDGAATLARALESVAGHVDEIVVVDTGSTDDSLAIARRYTDRVYERPWSDHFGEARQYAHDLCSGQWVFFIDADDEVFDARALRRRIQHAPDDMDAYMIRYVLGPDPGARASTEFWRERLIRRDRMRWVGRVHEVMVPITEPCRYERFAHTWVYHHGHGDAAASMARNIRLLETELADDPANLRAQFYLGRDYVMTGELGRGVELLEAYAANAVWDDEKFVALQLIGHVLRTQGKWREAFVSDLRLLGVKPLWPAAYYALAQDAYYAGRWEESIHWCEIGQGLPAPATNLFLSPEDHESGWMIYQAVALYHAGRLAEAAELTVRALQLRPGDPQHSYNAEFFTRELELRMAPAAEPATA